MSITFLPIEDEPFPFRIDVPMNAERARAIGAGPLTMWCRQEFGPLNGSWAYEKHGDTVRFFFRNEDALEKFASRWAQPRFHPARPADMPRRLN